MAGAAISLISGNFITARPVGIVDGVDFMHTGLVRKIDAVAVRRAIDTGALVMLSPFGFSHTGEAFNLSMEDVATSAAIALQADKLVFVTEVRGILQSIVADPARAVALEARQYDPDEEVDQELALADAKRLLAARPIPPSPRIRRSTCSTP